MCGILARSRWVGGGRRKAAGAIAALVASAVLAATAISTAAPTLAVATAFIIGTTFIPDSSQPEYTRGAMDHFVKPTTVCGVQSCAVVPVITPEQFWPFSGRSDMTINQSIAKGLSTVNETLLSALSNGTDAIVVFGDSQSSAILTLAKLSLADLPEGQKSRLTFVMVANPNRPNGGLLERMAPNTVPFIDLTASGATPTNTDIRTIDIVCQYDGIADLPRYPLNILADLNLIAGAAIHSSYITGPIGYTDEELLAAGAAPDNLKTYGDTTYIMIPAKQLPLVVPLRQFGNAIGLSALTTPIADLIEPTLRVLVELGYDRSIPYGEPAKFGLFPEVNAADLASDLAAAVQAGVDAALRDLGFGTVASEPSALVARPVPSNKRGLARGAQKLLVGDPGQALARKIRNATPRVSTLIARDRDTVSSPQAARASSPRTAKRRPIRVLP